MPWRKPYDEGKNMVEKGQRAYEVRFPLRPALNILEFPFDHLVLV